MATLSTNKNDLTVSISPWSILSVFGIFAGFVALYQLWDVVLLVFVAMILASALHGWVQWLADHKIPKIAGVLIIYASLFLLISGVVALLVPPLVEEIRSISSNFPEAFGKFTSSFSAFKDFINQAGVADEITNWLKSLTSLLTQGGTFGAVTGFFGSIVSIFVVLIMTLYMVVQDQAMKSAIHSILPERYTERASKIIEGIQNSVGLWLRAELVLMLIVALAAYIGLLILGVHNALSLALLAGLTEAIPTLGPILGAIPAIFFALLQSPIKAILVLVLYVIIQQLENHIIVPQVMRKAVGLNPLVSLIALLVGVKLAGIVGAILAIPVVTAAKVLIDDLSNGRNTPAHATPSS